jgi:hypothetical protein
MAGADVRPQEHLGHTVEQVLADPEIRRSCAEPEAIEGESYFGAPDLGLSFVAEGGCVTTVHVHVLPEADYRAYSYALPCALLPEMTRDEARELLGTPRSSGEQTRIPVLGPSPAWDLFEIDGVCLNVQYRLDGPGLSLLSFMLPEVVPL